MVLGTISVTRHLSIIPTTSSLFSSSATATACNFGFFSEKRRKVGGLGIRSSVDEREDGIESGSGERRQAYRPSVIEMASTSSAVTNSSGSAAVTSTGSSNTTVVDRGFSADGEFPVWEKIGAIVRLSYGIGIYGGMAIAGKFICSIAGVDCAGGFGISLKAIVDGLGYAVPPIMALLFILDDEIVKYSPHARAVRDVEDEELMNFFYGMSPWQFILIVTASSIGEELFYRVAVQGGLTDMFIRGTEFVKDARGIVSLTGMLPLFVPFAQGFAAVITATITGSLYYVATAPKDPTYIVSPVIQSRTGRQDLKKLFAAWYEKRQMKKIYSPLLEGLLALYLGFEWIQTDNIFAPMITHGIYSATILGHGLWKIHDHRRRLRNRIQQVRVESNKNSI
ncbi:hypothetical protein ZOSMA_49G00990 [Zostera marina]|uniref:CAAX prenyl protease 2/Lysostaphin resistance protein A-like domain-containing protein n=1 Tax=Zostera marina TaxID=29655 RepID=A0A0K9P1E6_ZOSMR|nr:hypothetical protein ZOSMA_49G00990 [Zostera marina]